LKIILLITENSEITDNIAKYKPNNLDLVVIRKEEFLRHYLEEYLPDYIIVNIPLKDFKYLNEYIFKNPRSTIFLTSSDKKSEKIYPNFIFTENVSLKKDIKEIISAISRIELETNSENEKKYKLVNQQIVSVVSFKGGTGKTTFSYNLAYFLQKTFDSNVLLMDLDFSEGPSDLSTYLKIKQIPNLNYYIENIDEGEDAIKKSVIKTKINGIDILLPPLSIIQGNKFNSDLLNKLLEQGKRLYNFVIMDLPNNFNSVIMEAISLSNSLLVVSIPEKSCALKLSKFNFKNSFKTQNIISILNNPYNNTSTNREDFIGISGYPVLLEISFIKRQERNFLDCECKNTDLINMQPEIKQLISKYLLI
jgi:MinD-like ATPase involved in chromosome partitioning or flagellar assembly